MSTFQTGGPEGTCNAESAFSPAGACALFCAGGSALLKLRSDRSELSCAVRSVGAEEDDDMDMAGRVRCQAREI